MERAAQKQSKNLSGFSAEARAALLAYSWPGNVRELENAVERAVTLESGEEIQLEHLPKQIISGASAGGDELAGPLSQGQPLTLPVKLDDVLNELARAYVAAALTQTGGDKKKAAVLLGITERKLSSIK